MKYVKLGLLSIVAFSLLIWVFTLLFPDTTVLSRVVNIGGNADSLRKKMHTNVISFKSWLIADSQDLDIRTSDIAFYSDNVYKGIPQPKSDTLFFSISNKGKTFVQGGVGFYQLRPDSVTTQLFYVFHTAWYKPWEKLIMMVVDKQYGPQMEAALERLKKAVVQL